MDEDADALAAMPNDEAWQVIYAKNLAMMEAVDMVIANLTPFRGASADAGTLVELSWWNKGADEYRATYREQQLSKLGRRARLKGAGILC